jgi:hypothetical protein
MARFCPFDNLGLYKNSFRMVAVSASDLKTKNYSRYGPQTRKNRCQKPAKRKTKKCFALGGFRSLAAKILCCHFLQIFPWITPPLNPAFVISRRVCFASISKGGKWVKTNFLTLATSPDPRGSGTLVFSVFFGPGGGPPACLAAP